MPNGGGRGGGHGGGGGGDLAPAQVRSEFEDTAYWNASVTTGADGIAEVCRILTTPGDKNVHAVRLVRANEGLTVEEIKARGSDIPAGWVDPLEGLA